MTSEAVSCESAEPAATRGSARPEPSVRSLALRGGFWLAVGGVVARGADFAKRVVLARVLSPADFGLMGIALIVLNWLEYFTETGFRPALIQKQGGIERYFDTAWTVQLIRSVVLAGGVWLLSPVAGTFFETERAVPLIRSLSVVLLLRGLTNPAAIYFRKNLEFRKQVVWDLSGAAPALAVGIAVGVLYRSVWALAASLIAAEATRTVVSHLMVSYRPRLALVREQAVELMTFGKWVFLLNVVNFLSLNLDSAAVGKMLGTTALGLYQMGYQCSYLLAMQASQMVTGVTFPAFSMLDGERRTRAFLEIVSLAAAIGIFGAFALSFLAEPLVSVLFGPKWVGAAPAVSILAWAGAALLLSRVTSTLFYAHGSPNRSTLIAAIRMLVIAASLWPLMRGFGIIGAAISVTVAEGVALALNVILAIRVMSVPWTRLAGAGRDAMAVAAPLVLVAPIRWAVAPPLAHVLTAGAFAASALPLIRAASRSFRKGLGSRPSSIELMET